MIFGGFQSKEIFSWSSKTGQDHGKLALVSFQEEEVFFIPAGVDMARYVDETAVLGT